MPILQYSGIVDANALCFLWLEEFNQCRICIVSGPETNPIFSCFVSAPTQNNGHPSAAPVSMRDILIRCQNEHFTLLHPHPMAQLAPGQVYLSFAEYAYYLTHVCVN